MNKRIALSRLSLVGLLLVSGCNLAPHYQRPAPPLRHNGKSRRLKGRKPHRWHGLNFLPTPGYNS
ncbi:hypothetical protein [Rosenbergiella epipactidis]|uniref:hypothetical protein n=1 Tax=Rosenbergiella epipactidis TaxID=1544694 RepID=UPI0030B8B264